MQLFADIWQLAVSLGSAVIFNPPSLPGWATWFTLIIRTIVILVIFRRNIAPFLLAKITRRIRARSISLLSIKGLYFRSRGRIWRVERVGWSLHPWAESRVSIKIEGLRVDIAKSRVPIRRTRAQQQRLPMQRLMAPLMVIREVIVSSERLLEWILTSSLFTWLRSFVSFLVIFGARLFIQCLPSLTQNVDFELDSAIISFEAFSGAHLIIQGITLSLRVDFSQLDKDVEVPISDATKSGLDDGHTRATPKHWNSIVKSAAARFWESIWGQAVGFAVVDVTVRQIVGYACPASPNLSSRINTLSAGGTTPDPVHPNPRGDTRLPSDVVFRIGTLFRISASSYFSPKFLKLKQRSLICSLQIPSIDVSVDGLQSLLVLDKLQEEELHEVNPPFFTHTEPRNPNSASTSIPAFPVLMPSTSPTSPIMNAFSQIARKRGSISSPAPPVQRLRESKVQPFGAVFKSVDICLPSIKISYSTSMDDKHITYLFGFDDLTIHLGVSDANTNPLHRHWLGFGDRSVLDGPVYALACHLGLATLSRIPSAVRDASIPLFALRKPRIDVLAHQWPQTHVVAPQFLSGDPNTSFVACEMSAAGVDVTGRLEDLRTSIDSAIPARGSSFASKSVPATLSCVPRVELRVACGDIRIHLVCGDGGSPRIVPTLHLHSPGFNVSLSTTFRTGLTVATHVVDSASYQRDIQMSTSCHVEWQPTFVRIDFPDDSEDQAQEEWEHAGRADPLIGVDVVDLTISINTLGYFGIADIVILEPHTSITDIRCIADGVSIDLWKPERIVVLRTLVDAARARTAVLKPGPPSTSLSRLLTGVSVHFSVGCLTCIATGPDINPSSSLELFRGLSLRTGISLQYCCMPTSRHPRRVNVRFAQARDRERLGLSEDLLIQAMAVARAGTDPDDVSALIQGLTWQTICRTAISTHYEYHADYDATEKNENGFISVPRAVAKIRLRSRRQITTTPNLVPEETCDITVNLPHFRSRFELLNAYSALLALHALHSLVPRQSNLRRLRAPSPLRTTFKLRVVNAHIFCFLPLHEKLFVRVLSASLERQSTSVFKTDCSSVVAWVPSPQVQAKWEELLRLRGTSIIITALSPGIKVKGTVDGFRVAIPNRYILSELILNIGVTAKALRHLRRTVQLGHYIQFQPPAAEAPRYPPEIDVLIRSITLEAADSPFEAKLGLIWRTGFQAQKIRIERELAFEAKLRAILASGDSDPHVDPTSHSDLRYHFTSKRTTSVADARNRLYMVHSNSWVSSISRQKEELGRKEDTIIRQLRHATDTIGLHVPIPIAIHTPEKAPPLFRAVVNGLSLSLAPPSFPKGYESFLAELGGIPQSMEYSLLLLMHLRCSLQATMMNIRDYHLPLLHVPAHSNGSSLEFVTDLVIAEEMGSEDSVEWLPCPIVEKDVEITGAGAFHIQVPKTIMPVKTYADPEIKFCTPAATEFTWGVSYNPAIQEVMRVLETLSHPPRDPSPAIGFWDKLRLVFHWRINATFKGGAHFHFKGSRDPYHIAGVGAGFDFRWDGNVAIKVGYDNDENELIQLSSDSMLIAIPDHRASHEGNILSNLFAPHLERTEPPSLAQENMADKKICAKFRNGIRWGVGLSLERTCDSECQTCYGDPFSRGCRFFTFVPHYQVILRSPRNSDCSFKDSYTGFRSNFIHFSTSLTSPIRPGGEAKHNSFHLTPKAFAHFWSWWHLFDSALSLPIRQGSLFPDSRPPSKKFGRHLATIKYRISFSPLYITHVYKIDSGDAWAAGESHCVGVKAFVEHFQADMHQREEETVTTGCEGDRQKVERHKPFSAVDVVITGLDLRALFAVFAEPRKRTILLKESPPDSTRFWELLEPTPLTFPWVDKDDFQEVDWLPSDQKPNLYLYEAAHCPRFVYFKRTTRPVSLQDEVGLPKTKFGDEDSHMCLMGKEPSAHEVQLEFGAKRLAELRSQLGDSLKTHDAVDIELPSRASGQKPFLAHASDATRETGITQMIALLERYIHRLSELRASASSSPEERTHKHSDDIYDMPGDITLPQELGEFGNVYQVHCPKISLSNATRDILHKYYLASRARRGFEYHMSARAVKFIRDQAHMMRTEAQEHSPEKRQGYAAAGAQAAAQAVRRMLTGDDRHRTYETSRNERQAHKTSSTDPLYGWDQGVSEQKAHLCLLVKPQIILRSEHSVHSVLVLAADHVVLKTYGILDTLNADDPVSGYIMRRNYADINSLQVFRPVDGAPTGYLPLEVFLDFRCESREFDRLVPQTNATLRYDKFNRLRLRNNVTTVAISSKEGDMEMVDHLLHETDLIVVEVPRFSISADASAFTSVADVVTNLLLFSDPVHKARMTQLETMLFSYDFTDLISAAKVIADLQSRIRELIRIEGGYALKETDQSDTIQQDVLATNAHIFSLSHELNLIFDAIRLAQDKTDDRNQEQKSALRLQASSSEISWQMLDETRELLAKLAVRGIDYSWLSRQDSSTTSILSVRDLQAFDGSPNALWPEVLAKHDDPPNHRMIRRGLFAEAQWSVLAPVGGISIYDYFEVELHPIRLALETQLGNKLMDYLIPGRRSRREAIRPDSYAAKEASDRTSSFNSSPVARTLDDLPQSAPQLAVQPSPDTDSEAAGSLTPRQVTDRKARLVASRSFSNLRSTAAESRSKTYHAPGLPKSSSSTALVDRKGSLESNDAGKSWSTHTPGITPSNADGDASEMHQRSAQMTFVHVKIPSVHVLLSVMKGRGFIVRDARLRTHDLEWRNRTWSFEELINQFVPSDPSWRGWVKVAWQQPVFSVGGVVKELITKTQWGRLGKQPEAGSPYSRTVATGSGSVHTPQDAAEGSSAGYHSFPAQGSNSGSSLIHDDSALRQPRRRSRSRPRVSSLFRRTGTRKPSVDSVELPDAQGAGAHKR